MIIIINMEILTSEKQQLKREKKMATEFKFNPTKTFANKTNARKAITNFLGDSEENNAVRFMIVESAGRFAPVVINSAGNSSSFAFHGFTVVG